MNLVLNNQQERSAEQVVNSNNPSSSYTDINRKLNLLRNLKITFESLTFNNQTPSSPTIWSNGLMIIFTKNILSILQDELLDEKQVVEYQQLQQRTSSLSLKPQSATSSSRSKSNTQIQQILPQPLVVNNQLWAFISNTLKKSTTDLDAKKLLLMLENDYNKNKTLNICLEWIIASFKTRSLLKQLKILYEQRTTVNTDFYKYYKETSILNDDVFLRDFFIYINAYETHDFRKVDDIEVFKMYNQLKRSSIDTRNSRYLTVSDDSLLNVRQNHRRLHSCPIIVPPEWLVSSSTSTGSRNSSESSTNGDKQPIFELEINTELDENENIEDTTKLNASITKPPTPSQSPKDEIYDKWSVLDYINSLQIYYERNLLDKENSHFLIADLAMSSIELLKDQKASETTITDQQQQQYQNMLHSTHGTGTIEPINLKKYHLRNFCEKSSSLNSSSSDFLIGSGSSSVNRVTYLPQIPIETTMIDLATQSIFGINDAVLDYQTTVDNSVSPSPPASENGDFETIDFNDDVDINSLTSNFQAALKQRERRFSWEYDLNDYQYTPESLTKNILQKYNELTIPKLADLKSIIESNEYLEFTQKFLFEKTSQQVLTDSTQTLIPPPSLLTNQQSQQQPQALIGDDKWAPVREQLIITSTKQKLNRIDVIKQQDYRCANCGIKVREDKIKQFRYCEYFSKYFCRCCHSKQESYIPSYIIFNLDFKQSYLVSNKAKKFLDKIYYEPLITLEDLNPDLFNLNSNKMSNLFSKVKYVRLKLVNCKRYITSCRLAIDLKKYLEENFSDFLYTDTRVYSIDCLYKFKKSNLYEQMKFILNKITQHILACEICSQQGFICELCKDTRLIYPFDIDNVCKCPNCLTCYHKAHFKHPDQCLKCKRKKLRTTTTTSPQATIDHS